MLDDEEAFETARVRVVGHLVDFVRVLRNRGVRVPADGTLAAARALAAVGLGDRERVRIALRSALVSREADLDAFDSLFPAFWRQLRGEDFHPLDPAPEMSGTEPVEGGPIDLAREATAAANPDPAGEDGAQALSTGSVSTLEETTDVDDSAPGSAYSPAGVRERVIGAVTRSDDPVEAAVQRLVDALAGPAGRGWTPTGSENIDVRRALRQSVAPGNPVLPLPRRGRERDAVRVALLVDVSRSVLDSIDRGFLLRVAATLHESCRSARTFFFDTSLREVTDAFEERGDAGAALERAETEWGGGTRIGHSLTRLREDMPRAIDRRTYVLVVSDGLETGELAELEAGMAWLSGRGASVLWLNPLAGTPGYEPAARGMERSLPYVDGLFAFANADDVEEVARQIERHGVGGPIDYRFDPRLANDVRDATRDRRHDK